MPAYKDEARGTWYCQFRYTDYQGKTHSTTKRGFRTKKEAVQYETDFKNRAKNAQDLTVAALCDAYLADKKINTKRSTYVNLASTVNTHIRPTLGPRIVNTLTNADVRDWQNDIIQKGHKRNGKPLAPGTIKKISKQMSSLFNYAVKYYGLRLNPIKVIGNVGKFTARQEFWSVDEFQKVMACVKKPKFYLAFNLLFYSGMRVGELLALSAADFDFTNNAITINKNMATSIKIIYTPKTDKSYRTIPMPPSVMKLAKDYIDSLQEVPERIIFTTQATLLRYLKKYAAEAGVKPIHTHDLRHSHASHLIHEKVPITTISRRLGHANPAITLSIYAHMYEDSADDVAAMLEKSFSL
jgi:integrase